jgi:hypothetical protein
VGGGLTNPGTIAWVPGTGIYPYLHLTNNEWVLTVKKISLRKKLKKNNSGRTTEDFGAPFGGPPMVGTNVF